MSTVAEENTCYSGIPHHHAVSSQHASNPSEMCDEENDEPDCNEDFVDSQDENQSETSKTDIRPHPNIYIRNLPPSFTVRDLSEFFAVHGEVRSLHILTDPITKKSKCVGFVRFATSRDAIAAIAATNGTIISGSHRPLVVRFADRKPRAPKSSKNRKQPRDPAESAAATFFTYPANHMQQSSSLQQYAVVPGQVPLNTAQQWPQGVVQDPRQLYSTTTLQTTNSLPMARAHTIPDNTVTYSYTQRGYSPIAPFATVIDPHSHTYNNMYFTQQPGQSPLNPIASLPTAPMNRLPSNSLSSPSLSFPSSSSPSSVTSPNDSMGSPASMPSRASGSSFSTLGMRDSRDSGAMCPVRIHVPKMAQRTDMLPGFAGLATVGHVRPGGSYGYPSQSMEPNGFLPTFNTMPDNYASYQDSHSHVHATHQQQQHQQQLGQQHHYQHMDSQNHRLATYSSEHSEDSQAYRSHHRTPQMHQTLSRQTFSVATASSQGPPLDMLSLQLTQGQHAPLRHSQPVSDLNRGRASMPSSASIDAGDVTSYSPLPSSPFVRAYASPMQHNSLSPKLAPSSSVTSHLTTMDVHAPWRPTLALRNLPGDVSLVAVLAVLHNSAPLLFHAPAASRLFEHLHGSASLAPGQTVPLLFLEFASRAEADAAQHALLRSFPQVTVSPVGQPTELGAILTLPAAALKDGESMQYYEVFAGHRLAREVGDETPEYDTHEM